MSDIIKALETLKENKWIDLTHNINPSIPKFGAFPNLNIETLYTIKKDGFFVDKVSFVTQYGTHIDAPIHFSENKRTLEQLELKELVLPLFIINKEKEVENNSDFILTEKDVLEWEKENGKIEKILLWHLQAVGVKDGENPISIIKIQTERHILQDGA